MNINLDIEGLGILQDSVLQYHGLPCETDKMLEGLEPRKDIS